MAFKAVYLRNKKGSFLSFLGPDKHRILVITGQITIDKEIIDSVAVYLDGTRITGLKHL